MSFREVRDARCHKLLVTPTLIKQALDPFTCTVLATTEPCPATRPSSASAHPGFGVLCPEHPAVPSGAGRRRSPACVDRISRPPVCGALAASPCKQSPPARSWRLLFPPTLHPHLRNAASFPIIVSSAAHHPHYSFPPSTFRRASQPTIFHHHSQPKLQTWTPQATRKSQILLSRPLLRRRTQRSWWLWAMEAAGRRVY